MAGVLNKCLGFALARGFRWIIVNDVGSFNTEVLKLIGKAHFFIETMGYISDGIAAGGQRTIVSGRYKLDRWIVKAHYNDGFC